MKFTINLFRLGWPFLALIVGLNPVGLSRALAQTNGVNQPLRLDDALRLALSRNPEIRRNLARVEAATGRADQAGRWPNPELELVAEDVPGRSGELSESKTLIGVAQTVPFPGKPKAERAIGRHGLRAQEAERAAGEIALVRDVKLAFWKVLAAEVELQVTRELTAMAESSARLARVRVESGELAYPAQLRAEVEWEQARNEARNAQQSVALARQELARLIGQPDLQEAPVAGTLDEIAGEPPMRRRPADWPMHHPDLQAGRARMAEASAATRRAALAPYPDVRLSVAGGRDGAADASIMEFRIGLPLPIFDRAKGNRQEAEARFTEAEAQLQATELRLRRDWDAAAERYHTAVAQVTRCREQILPKATEALQLVQTGFEYGKFGFLDLLDTQRTVAEARLAYQRQLFELHAAEVELEALLGAPVESFPPPTLNPTP
ncbi:MAG TPA: TolC family protein [Verrucomicrobiota bacterium]|nr:TolC family protein [Verrucomicrobiota bacterium]HQB16407.1 TolC family protein [Verrucomicrobiota bacterium]